MSPIFHLRISAIIDEHGTGIDIRQFGAHVVHEEITIDSTDSAKLRRRLDHLVGDCVDKTRAEG